MPEDAQVARRKGPLGLLSAMLDWLGEHWKLVTGLAVIAALFVPGLYGCVARRLPKAHYYVGSFGNPPAFTALPDWQIEMSPIDQSPPARKMDTLLTAFGRLLRLPEGTSYIPAHSAASSLSQEVLGRQWDQKQCLYVDDIELVLLDENALGGKLYSTIDPRGPRGPARAIGMTASEIKRRTPAGGSRSATYLAMLPAAVKSPDCARSGDGRRCARIGIWAYGSPVPCSLSLFGALSG